VIFSWTGSANTERSAMTDDEERRKYSIFRAGDICIYSGRWRATVNDWCDLYRRGMGLLRMTFNNFSLSLSKPLVSLYFIAFV